MTDLVKACRGFLGLASFSAAPPSFWGEGRVGVWVGSFLESRVRRVDLNFLLPLTPEEGAGSEPS